MKIATIQEFLSASYFVERKVISNDREALFLYAVSIFFFSRFESRGSRKTEFNSPTDNRDRSRNTEKRNSDENRTHSSFFSLSLSLSLYLSSEWHEANELSNSCRPSKSDYRRFLCTQTSTHCTPTVCIDFRRSVYQQLISPAP